MTAYIENFAPGGERSSQMLSSGCALRIDIDRLRSKTDIGLGELLDMPLECHEGLGRQLEVGNKDRIVASKLGVVVSDRLSWIARLVAQSQLSLTGWKRATAGRKSGVISSPLKPSIAVPARLGNAIILVFVVVFGGWGYFAPLDGGAVAPGVINPDSGKKTIQHLEGGIIAEMRVREGEAVTVGQPLVVLESTQARAAYDSLVQQRWALLARKARQR